MHMQLWSYLAEKHLDVGNLCKGATLSAVQSLNANDQPSKTKAILAGVGVNHATL